MISSLKSKFDFFNLRAIYLSANKLSVYHFQQGKLGKTYLFDIDDIGRENVKRYLKESDNTPVYILVDIIEEEFKQDTIPHVFGSDRNALIKRKQSRLFRDALYCYALSQGREAHGRRDDRLLFMALTNDELIKFWVTLFNEHNVPVKGILSFPQLLNLFIKTLPDVSDHALFVTMQSISGLRQTFFKNGELRISRLSKLPRYGIESYVPYVNDEIDKMQRYLSGLRLIPDNVPLDIYILADKITLDQFENEKKVSLVLNYHSLNMNLSPFNYHLLDINQLSKPIGLKSDVATPFCDPLFLFYLLKSSPANCYASDQEMHYNTICNMRYAINVCSVLFLISSLIYGGFNFIEGLIYKQHSEEIEYKIGFYSERHKIAKGRLTKTPVDSYGIKQAVDIVDAVNLYKSTPHKTMSLIGQSLEKYPDIKLDSLKWHFSISAESDPDQVSPPNPEDTRIRYYHIARINGHIESFDGDYRRAIAIVNQLVETLRNDRSVYDVSIESMPLDISSNASLSGNTAVIDTIAKFTLKTIIGINQ